MRHCAAAAAVLMGGALGGCINAEGFGRAVSEPSLRQLEASDFVEILPGVRISESLRTVAFDAVVAMDCHDPETPDVYLEVICCAPDTREHEALVVTGVAPSSVHAALLALGAEPGRPGGWRRDGDAIVPVPPRGERVRVWFLTSDTDGRRTVGVPETWIIHQETGETMAARLTGSAWVFAGSRIREYQGREVYDADGTGQLIGLHTFGSETIAWTRVESPHAAVDEPVWLANAERVPPIGTPVSIRIELVAGE